MTDCDTYRVPTPNGRSAVTGRFNPPPTAGDTTPISDEAVAAFEAVYWHEDTAKSREWPIREALAAARPLLVSAEAETQPCVSCEEPTGNPDTFCDACRLDELEQDRDRLRAELDSERTARARDLVRYSQDAMFLRLNAAETQRDEALDLVEGLRAELAEVRAELDLAYAEGANIGAEIGAHAAREVARNAQTVMELLDQHGAGIVGHLLDTDDNAGQRLRSALARLAALRAAGGQEKPTDGHDHPPCCDHSEGSLSDPHGCWDCQNTGHAHAPAAPVGGQAEPSDNGTYLAECQTCQTLREPDPGHPIPRGAASRAMRCDTCEEIRWHRRANVAPAAAVSGEHQDAIESGGE